MFNNLIQEPYEIGSVLARPKGFVHHKGIYLGNGQVFTNTPERGEHITTLADFAQGKKVTVEKVPTVSTFALNQRTFAAVASGRKYDLFTNNCDHAVNRVLYGEASSPQLVGWGTVVAAVLTLALLP